MRQLPGRANSMGAIKFMMPNDYGIYLHDTNDKALFASRIPMIGDAALVHRYARAVEAVG